MVNYQDSKLYKIECNITGKVYIGSTTKKYLSMRLAGHVANYKCYLNGKHHYVTSFDIIQNGNYDIILLENFPCDSKDQLLARERFWTNQIDCINKCKNQGLYIELGKREYKKQHSKQYKTEYKEHLQQKHQCECGGKYITTNKSHHLKSKKHREHEKNEIYYLIKKGLTIIKELDAFFEGQQQ